MTQPMQRCRVRGYHRLGREQGNRATKRDWHYACMGFISAPQVMQPEDTYSLAVFLQSGLHDPYSSLSSPLGSKYHIQNHPTRISRLVGMFKGSGAQMAYR